jgi:hypothetical protein
MGKLRSTRIEIVGSARFSLATVTFVPGIEKARKSHCSD